MASVPIKLVTARPRLNPENQGIILISSVKLLIASTRIRHINRYLIEFGRLLIKFIVY